MEGRGLGGMRALQLKGRGLCWRAWLPSDAALIGPRGGFSGAAFPAGRPGNGGGPRVEAAGAAPADGGRRRPAHPLPLLALFQRASAVRRARRPAPEARHPGAIPVRGHGRGRALCQLHVLRGQAALVRPGGRPAAGGGHLRCPRRGPGALRRMAQGEDVLAHHRHHRRFPDPGQRCWGAVQAETPQPLPAVHGPGVPGHLPHLPGLLPAAQHRGPPGLPGPPAGGRAGPAAALPSLRAAGPGLPLGLLRAHGGAGAGRAAAPGHPAHRWQPGLLARPAPRRVLEPDEAHRPERRHLRGRGHPGHGWMRGSGDKGWEGFFRQRRYLFVDFWVFFFFGGVCKYLIILGEDGWGGGGPAWGVAATVWSGSFSLLRGVTALPPDPKKCIFTDVLRNL